MNRRAGFALAGLALVAAWATLSWPEADDADATAEPAVAVAAPASPAERVEGEGQAGFFETATDSADLIEAEAAHETNPGELQVCGGAWVKLDAEGGIDADAGAALERQAVEAVEAPTLAALRASRDTRMQAAALHIAADRLPASRDALARLAVASIDPTVYAWAWQGCRPAAAQAQPEGPCRLLNAGQWARLDPGNAAPWLALAAMAQSNRDAAAADEAMFQAASARHHDTGSGRLPALLIDAAPADPAKALGVWFLAVHAFAAEQPIDGSDIAAADLYCRRGDLADANRRTTCQRIAVLLATRSNAEAARELGRRLGERLDLPEQRLAPIEPEPREPGLETVAETAFDERTSSCAGLRERLARVRGSGDSADVEALQRAAEATGRSTPRAAVDVPRTQPSVVGDAAGSVVGADVASRAASLRAARSGC